MPIRFARNHAAHSARPRVVLAAACLAAVAAAPLHAQAGAGRTVHPTPAPVASAAERTGPVVLDGRPDERAWAAATPITQFTQSDPDEGRPATQRTEVRFLYDAEAIYVGARMYDSLGARGVRSRLRRRDQSVDANGNSLGDADFLFLAFDTFHDHLGRAFFQVSPPGVKYDALAQGAANADASWDAIWDVVTAVDSLGWTAEFRIPLSQLRFPPESAQTWGVQVNRFISRLNETDHFAFWTRKEVGGPSRYGHLEGLRIATRSRRAEVMPYVVAKSSHIAPTKVGDPFNTGAATDYRVGGDLKYLISSNLTLDATINPDFGQVEVDPAVVNLTAFETFFPERRPFFVEGAGIFGFGGLSCFFCSNVSSLDAFYSRRIGRTPHLNGYVDDNFAYADTPENSTILGAAKVTGRTRRGSSVGLLEALTRAERAPVIADDGARSVQKVEPLSNYLVGRLKHDFRDGNVVLGAIATSTWRDLDDSLLASRLDRHAEVVGADWSVQWRDKTYMLTGSALLSSIEGDPAAILRAQRGSARYFQRPDRTPGGGRLFSDRLDSSATSMRGYGAYARLSKDAGSWLWESSVNVRSPGFETNDLSFLTSADYFWHNANVFRQYTTPTRYFRQLNLIAGGQEQLNFDGMPSERQLHGYVGATLPNFWQTKAFVIYRPVTLDDRLTRGGPVVKRTGLRYGEVGVTTDSRRSVVLDNSAHYGTLVGERGFEAQVASTMTLKPRTNVSLSVGPSYFRFRGPQQYVTEIDSSPNARFFDDRFVFASIRRTELSMETRLNVTFTPTLSLELFAQPFLASGDYFDFKEFAAPRSLRKHVYGPGEIEALRDAGGVDTAYVVAPSDNPTRRFSFANPDFNTRSLRGNAVLRWEYRPGSTLFFVWTQQRDDEVVDGDFVFTRDRSALFRAHPDNVFLVKVSYWMGL